MYNKRNCYSVEKNGENKSKNYQNAVFYTMMLASKSINLKKNNNISTENEKLFNLKRILRELLFCTNYQHELNFP